MCVTQLAPRHRIEDAGPAQMEKKEDIWTPGPPRRSRGARDRIFGDCRLICGRSLQTLGGPIAALVKSGFFCFFRQASGTA